MREHLALPAEQALVFGLGVLRLAVDEALHLVELVHADDAAGVLAVAARLAPEARRPARVAPRTVGQIEDLVGVVAGQRHLGGADEVEVVGLEPVDLVGVRAEEPGALHDLGPHQHGRDDEREAVLGGEPDRELHEAELQQRAVPGEEVEARAGHLGAALHVDQPERLTEFQVVLRIVDRRRLADGVEHHEVVLAAGGYAVDDDVRDRHVRGGERLARRRPARASAALTVSASSLACASKAGRSSGDAAPTCLLAAFCSARRLSAAEIGGPTVRVGVQQRVDEGGILAAGPLRRAHPLRVFAQQLEVDHGGNPTFDRRPPTRGTTP